jgi:hypothetical protein
MLGIAVTDSKNSWFCSGPILGRRHSALTLSFRARQYGESHEVEHPTPVVWMPSLYRCRYAECEPVNSRHNGDGGRGGAPRYIRANQPSSEFFRFAALMACRSADGSPPLVASTSLSRASSRASSGVRVRSLPMARRRVRPSLEKVGKNPEREGGCLRDRFAPRHRSDPGRGCHHL